MALTSTINYDNASNFTFDNTKVEFSGSPVRAKLLKQNAQDAKNQSFASDTGFTYDSGKAEFASGVVRQLDQTPANSLFGVRFDTDANPVTTEANLNWHKSGGSTTATLNGAPTIASNRLVCTGTQGVYYSKATTVIETLKFIYVPNYTTTPPANINMVSIWNGTNNNDRFNLTNSPSGNTLRLTLYNNVGGTVIAAATTVGAAWTPTAGQAYEFEVVIDSSAGTVRVFIDGTLHGTNSPGAWTRGTAASRYYLGASPSIYDRGEASFDDFIVFDNAQHTTSYTPGYTIPQFIYTNSNVDLPAFAYAGTATDGTFLSYDNFATVETAAPRYTIKTDSGSFLWWSGSAWTASDGTFAQANVKSTIIANLAALTAANGALSATVRIHFNGSNTQQIVDDLTLTVDEHTEYPTTNESVLQNSSVLTDDLETFTETTSVVAGSDDIRYIMQIDGQDKYWDGSSWVNSDGTYAQANTPSDVNTNALSLFLTAIGGTLKIKALLHSDSGATTPQLEVVTLEYNFYNIQTGPATCTIWGFYRDLSGAGVEGATVTFSLARRRRQYREAGDAIIEKPIVTTTDANGRFEAELIRSSEFESAGDYKLSIVKVSDDLETSKVDGVNIEFTVPDLDNENITDLISPTT